jgi:uncharacterized protein (DUF927 family)
MDDRTDKFAPLSETELAAGTSDAQGQRAREEKPIPPPAEAELPEAAAVRLFGRSPDALWRYLNEGGALVFCVCRWNKPNRRKDILPLSWFDGEGWRFAHWADPRPLYNLNVLAVKLDAPVIVTEGEKAADAAARIFPKSVATTSSGGSCAYVQTDWTLLAGRRILIWPDNDEPGTKYAHEVAAILARLDCEVSVIDPAALYEQVCARVAATELAEVEKRAAGYDAADAFADWPDTLALRKLAVGLAIPFNTERAYLSFPPYKMNARGLHINVEQGRGQAKHIETLWIAAPFEVLGACRDRHGAGWGKVLRWRDGDGRQHAQHVADADMQGEPAKLCAGLAHVGLQIDRGRQRELVGYLASVQAVRRVTVVPSTGWHEVNGRSVFVLPGETIGPRGDERVILDAAAQGPYETRGSIKEWRDGVARLAEGQVLPILAISAALAGPPLYLAGVEGGGVHFFGQSSRGKTTLLQLAASVWGRGATPGYVRAWRATANGLEGAAAGATDTSLILDELGQIDGRELAAALYALANGSGKARATRDGALRDPRTWRVLTISSGELPVDAKLTEDRGRKARAGQKVRMLDIPASRLCGVFDHAGPEGDAAVLANTCKLAAVSAYGSAGPEFVRRLIAEDVRGDDVRAMVADFVTTQLPPGADGQVDRAARRLGLIAAAGELATNFGLTAWREGEARDAAAWALMQWIAERGGTEPEETSQAIAQVRHFIEMHGEARFDNLDDVDGRPVTNRAGWRKGVGDDRRWMVPPETWRAEVCVGLDPKFVAGVLASLGVLAKGSDGNMRVERIAGTTKRVYVVTPRIFAGGEE